MSKMDDMIEKKEKKGSEQGSLLKMQANSRRSVPF